jgi:predicted XRE-type DNA-binding protein
MCLYRNPWNVPIPQRFKSAKMRWTHAIGQIIKRGRLTQMQVEALTGIPQSNVSRIVRGRVSGFSVSKLLEMLRSLGKDIEIILRDHDAQVEARGTIKVVVEPQPAAA